MNPSRISTHFTTTNSTNFFDKDAAPFPFGGLPEFYGGLANFLNKLVLFQPMGMNTPPKTKMVHLRFLPLETGGFSIGNHLFGGSMLSIVGG